MSASIARIMPHHTPPEGLVEMGAWHDLKSTARVRLPERLPSWIPGEEVSLGRQVSIDVPAVLAACRLPDDARLRVISVAVSMATSTRLSCEPLILDRTSARERLLELTLDGDQISGTLELRTYVTTDSFQPCAPLVPWRPGLILWEDTQELALAGAGSRFPMEALDFTRAGFRWPARAAWRLDWDREALDEPVLGCLRLFLNTAHPGVMSMLTSPGAPESLVMRDVLEYEVARALICGALGSEVFVQRQQAVESHVEGAGFERDSLGEMLGRMFGVLVRPGASISTLYNELQSEPELFEARLQDTLKFMHHTGEDRG